MNLQQIPKAFLISMLLFVGIVNVHAQALDVVNASNDTLLHIENNGNIGIGSTSFSTNIGFNKIFKFSGSGNIGFLIENTAGRRFAIRSGSNNSLDFLNDTASLTLAQMMDTGNFIVPGGNIGIGLTNPVALLHAAGSTVGSVIGLRIENLNTTIGNSASLLFQIRDLANLQTSGVFGRIDVVMTDNTGGAADGDMTFSTTQNGVTSEKLRLTNNGDVGVGTTTPGAKLEVVGDVKIVDGTQGSGKVLTSDANGLASWQTPATGGGDGIADADDDTKIQVEESTDEDKIRFDTGGVERMIVDESGNVGIGTTTPVEVLQVVGNVQIDDTLVVEGEVILSENIQMQAGKNINGAGSLSMSSNNFTTIDGLNGVSLFSQGAERLRVHSSGNVGIGTITPGAKLDIAGDIKVTDGTQGAGKVMTSDVNGLARWQTPSTSSNLADADSDTKIQVEESADEDKIRFDTGGSERMIIDEFGNVGIGTATPNEQLEITNNFRLPASTATAGVIFSDGNPYIHNFGTGNFFAGDVAGNLTMSGANNTGVGVNAMFSNTSGLRNTGCGFQTLGLNTTGNENTAIGYQTLFSNNGSSNTATGFQVLRNNTTGGNNTATGYLALNGNIAGGNNTATGREALLSNSTGSNNTSIGFQADVGSGNLTNATAIGANAVVNTSNSLVLGNGANVGIGTSSPTAKLDIAGDIKIIDGTQGAGKVLTSDLNGLASWQTPAGGGGGGDFSDGGEAGGADRTLGNMDNFDLGFLTNNTTRLHIQNNGNVGIGTATPAGLLDVKGSVGNVIVASDGRTITAGGAGTSDGIFAAPENANILIDSDDSQTTRRFNIYKNSVTSGNELFTVQESGNVGIGQFSPGAKLEIVGDIKIVDGTQGAGKVLTSDAAGLASWQTPTGGGGGDFSDGGEAGGADRTLGNTDNFDLGFLTNNMNRLHIQNDGNIGIGTTTPNEQLELTGNLRLPTTTATTGIIMSDGTRFIHNFGSNNFFAGVNAGTLTVTGGSNTGIGISALGSNTGGFSNTANGAFALQTNTSGFSNTAIGAAAMQINTTGSSNTAIGIQALQSNTTGSHNTGNGAEALKLSTGSQNTAVGSLSLQNNTTASNNTAMGAFALRFNTTGVQNTALGTGALQNNTTTSNNTAMGYNALNLSTGSSNTAVGANALDNNTSAASNTAVGASALTDNSTGGSNTAVGTSALENNTTANNNTATGRSALLLNTTGTQNTANGAFALQNNNGANNSAVGYLALLSNTTGGQNTAVGALALDANTTASSNTAVGSNALTTNITGSRNTAVGANALQNNTASDNTAHGYFSLLTNTGSNNTAVGSEALRTNTAASSNTAVGSDALRLSTGSSNTAVGTSALANNASGGGNTAVGISALTTNTTGSSNTALGAGANVNAGNLTNATAIGSSAIVDASNKVRIGNASVAVIEGQVDFTFSSDSTKKENFLSTDGEEVLRKLRKFRLGSWNYKGHDAVNQRHYGAMAQDFHAAFGHDGFGIIGTDTTLTGSDINGINMIAVQALEARTVALQKENTQMSKEMDALKAEMSELKKTLKTLMSSN